MTKLTPFEQQLLEDVRNGKYDNKPIMLTCLSCSKEFELDMDTSVCQICNKPICNECRDDLNKLIHHEEQKVRFYNLMTDPKTQADVKLMEENEKLKKELAELKARKKHKTRRNNTS